jgi:hypothetical protein
MRLVITSLLGILLLLPFNSHAFDFGTKVVDFGLHLETGVTRGGQEVAEMRKPEEDRCNEWEQFWSEIYGGCSDYYDVSAGDGSETSLGGIVQFNTKPMVIMRVSKTIGGGPISEAGHHYRGLVITRPHTDFLISLGGGDKTGHAAFGVGISQFKNTTIDLTNFPGTSDLGGNYIEFDSATGWFLEITTQARYIGFGFRRMFVDYRINKIDNTPVDQGRTVRGDYGMVFIFANII